MAVVVTIASSFTPADIELVQYGNDHKHRVQARMQRLYEDVPYNVDPVISADSYIPKFAAPADRNTIYQGVDEDSNLPSIYEDGPHIDEITGSSFKSAEERDPVYQGVYAGYEAAKAKGTQMLYEDVPYNVDPVISADSYIPRFKAPEERNEIYQGVYAGYEPA